MPTGTRLFISMMTTTRRSCSWEARLQRAHPHHQPATDERIRVGVSPAFPDREGHPYMLFFAIDPWQLRFEWRDAVRPPLDDCWHLQIQAAPSRVLLPRLV